jgi:hypothetical protein
MEKHLFATPDAPTGDAEAEAEEDVGDDDAGGDDYAESSDDIDDWED